MENTGLGVQILPTHPLGPQEIPINASEMCMARFGVEPKVEQLEVTGSIGRGEDIILIAACGWGKSLVYYLPLVFWDRGVIVIVSPLRAIMAEQHQKLERLEISSVCLMGEDMSITNTIITKLTNGDYRAVFMTPEIMFENRLVEGLWSSRAWQSQLRAIVLDEAHCVFTWGDSFRKHYSQLGSLRPRLPSHVAFVALSATLPPDVLHVVKKSCGMDSNTRVINTGNDRPNVKLMVVRMQIQRYTSLDFLLEGKVKTIVYFDTLKELQEAHDYLRSKPEWHDTGVAAYFSILSEEYKISAMEEFKNGQVLVLLATEAAGMGCDVSDIVRVIQFGAPPCILTLVQRLGRAARTPGIRGYGIVFCSVKELLGNVADTRLGEYLSTTGCRRKVLDKVFLNKRNEEEEENKNTNCCDACGNEPSAVGLPTRRIRPYTHIRYIPKTKRLTTNQEGAVRDAIIQWREKTYNKDIGCRAFFQATPNAILSNDFLKRLVHKAPILDKAEAVQEALKTWSPWNEEYYQQLAHLIQNAIAEASARVAYPVYH